MYSRPGRRTGGRSGRLAVIPGPIANHVGADGHEGQGKDACRGFEMYDDRCEFFWGFPPSV